MVLRMGLFLKLVEGILDQTYQIEKIRLCIVKVGTQQLISLGQNILFAQDSRSCYRPIDANGFQDCWHNRKI